MGRRRSARLSRELPARLERARTRFEDWRAVRESRQIPDRLWRLAAELAEEFGVHGTARALRLNYESLKTRVGVSSSARAVRDSRAFEASPFMELVPGVSGEITDEGAAELETGDGARIRVSWRGAAPDLARLSRSFLYGERA